MKIQIRKLLEMLKVANDDVIGNTARQIFNLNWKEGLSARNQAHKILEELALTDQIKKGKGWYSVKDYQGEYKEHDQAITRCSAELIKLKLPITLYRERSLSNGLRPDLIGLIGRNGKALCFVQEFCINESDATLEQKVVAWKHNNPLEEVFGFPIPHFTLVVHGKSHPEMMDFNNFLEEVKHE